jgi:membrane associated rhomboid family serine protease
MSRRALPSPILPRAAGPGHAGLVLLAVVTIVCVLIETVLFLADTGVLGAPRLRGWVYENGAFWPGLVGDWRPNYAGQPVTMFLSYAFLHGGPGHLALNMVTLWSLGTMALQRVGALRFAVLYLLTAIAGAGLFAFLATSGQPMVGASGALFGLAGAILAWIWDDQPSLRDALRFAGRAVLFLLALNVALHFLLGGALAWQAHLGGFLAGWVLGIALDPAAPR